MQLVIFYKKKRVLVEKQTCRHVDVAPGGVQRSDCLLAGDPKALQLCDHLLGVFGSDWLRLSVLRLCGSCLRDVLYCRGLDDCAGRSTDPASARPLFGGFLVAVAEGILGDFTLAEELDFLALDDEAAALQIQNGLVALQHVQAQEEIDILALHDGKGARQMEVANLELGAVDLADDLGCADAAGDA